MKSFLVLICFLTVTSYAQEPHIEFNEENEVKCHQELKHLGCLNPNEEQDQTCIDAKATQLSSDCQNLHKEQRKWRKSLTGFPASQKE